MNFTKKKELFYDENALFGWKFGYSLGTVYRNSIKHLNTIELWNFGYCPSTKEFYYTKNIHLPKVIIDCFQGESYNEYNIAQMKKLGIFDGDKIQTTIEQYEKQKKEMEFSKKQMKLEKQNLFKKTSKK